MAETIGRGRDGVSKASMAYKADRDDFIMRREFLLESYHGIGVDMLVDKHGIVRFLSSL